MSSTQQPNNDVLNLRFNQDFGCFVCSTHDGIRVFNMEPLVEKLHLNKDQIGSIEQVEMYMRSNLIAIVPGGNHPLIAPNSVLIWDDKLKKFVMEFTFKSKVHSIRMGLNRLVVVLLSKIHVFSFPNKSKKLFTFDTCNNNTGICDLSVKDDGILCFPSVKSGFVQISDIKQTNETSTKSPSIFQAHKNDIALLVLDYNSKLLATASTQGTLIRIFNVKQLTQIQKLIEFRRGMETAALYSMNFSRDSSFLCVASNRGTVHIFSMLDFKVNNHTCNTTIKESRAMCKFEVPSEVPCVCCFGDSLNNVFCICVDGSFYKYVFSDDGKNCLCDVYENFLDISIGSDF